MTEVTMLMCTGTSSKDYLLERHSHFSINFPQLLGPDGQVSFSHTCVSVCARPDDKGSDCTPP